MLDSRGFRRLLRALSGHRNGSTLFAAIGAARAAVLSQIADEAIHGFKVRGVDELTTIALLSDQPRTMQLLQMEREG